VAADEATGRDDRAVAKLQALVRIPTVSNRDPALVDTEAFDRLLVELERQFPLLHERLELTRHPQPRPALPLARRERAPAGRADGAPRRRPGGGRLAARAVRRRRRRRQHLGPRHARRQGLPGRDLRGGRDPARAGTSPAQDVWLSFGCDEEVYRRGGALAVGELERRGVGRGSSSTRAGRSPPGVPGRGRAGRRDRRDREGRDVVELRVEGRGGHAVDAGPDRPTARLARAITRIDRSPMAASTPSRPSSCFRRLAPHAHRWSYARRSRTPAASARCCPGAHRGRPGVGGDDADHVRRHHAVG
jgi:carboxypeptidase PM20D1